MPTVMTKYKYNNNLFLVYNTNLLNNNFSADELQQLSRDIQTDYIIIFNGGKINFYNAQGEEISADTDMNKIALYHQTKDVNIDITREIEVRFTDSYINRIMTSNNIFQSYIA
ncbi:hypothetical protein [Megamonas hypermegale]|nr:hypothetical protein [Megamonas hypermegale]MBM6762090.1 hypothetical protein [Megamonas hypermegale]